MHKRIFEMPALIWRPSDVYTVAERWQERKGGGMGVTAEIMSKRYWGRILLPSLHHVTSGNVGKLEEGSIFTRFYTVKDIQFVEIYFKTLPSTWLSK